MNGTEQLRVLFKRAFQAEPNSVQPMGAHASKRRMFRISGCGHSVIGVVNDNKPQNRAFLGFTEHFHQQGLPVPQLFGVDEAGECYLQEDLGPTTLLDELMASRKNTGGISDAVLHLYEDAVRLLPEFQIRAGKSLDYSLCSQRTSYDAGNMLWDMTFFRDSFVKELGISFDEPKLQKDFENFAKFLSQADSQYFMYRDFQARNIMVRGGKLYFIDYQEGRRGPLQYDLVSILYQSKADLPAETRKVLFNLYLEAAAKYVNINREAFLNHYHGFIFIRLMQVLGTYGEQGLKGKKEYFRQSIPFALKNLAHLIENVSLPVESPELSKVLHALAARASKGQPMKNKLTVSIQSFSFRHGIPQAESDHGGGFVFDCRCIPNPGREEQYKALTGLDKPVQDFLNARSESSEFFNPIRSIVAQATKSYLERGMDSLSVWFGCTGGQHRSVFFSELLKTELSKRSDLAVEIRHLGLEELARKEGERI